MQNFGKIKNAFNGILAESIVSKNGANKSLFKKYIKTIRENEILKTQFLVYDNIENKMEENEFKATQFVQENIRLFDKFTKKEILEANLLLSKPILFEQETKSSNENVHEILHENISKLIFTDKSVSNIDSIIETTANIVNYIETNKKSEIVEAIGLPISMISTMMVDKYNERYSSLDESERKILKVLIDSTDEEKQEVYKTTIRECIVLINEKLTNADLEAKEKLLLVKDKLLNDKVEINEDFSKNISKLVELKNNLK